jgi:hypothetical protein
MAAFERAGKPSRPESGCTRFVLVAQDGFARQEVFLLAESAHGCIRRRTYVTLMV